MRILPRRLGQVLTDAMTTLAKVWRPLAPTAIAAFVPASLLTLLVFHWTGIIELIERILADPMYLQRIPTSDYDQIVRSLIQAGFLVAAIQGVATVFVFLFANRLVRSALVGEAVSAREARRHAAVRMFSGITAGLLGALTVVGAFALGVFAWAYVVNRPTFTNQILLANILLLVLISPAVWLAISMSMFTSVVSFEEAGVSGSLRRSIDLVRGRWGQTLMFLILVGLFGTVAIQLIQLIALPLSFGGQSSVLSWVVALFGVAAQGLILASIGATYAHWYIDLRARKEPVLVNQL
jgi:hypothetical protein